MPENILKVVSSELRIEANNWRKRSEDMKAVKSQIDNLDLGASAFFIGSPMSSGLTNIFNTMSASVYSKAYAGFHEYMKTVTGEAVTEFEQLGGALDKMAAEYDNADAAGKRSLEEVDFSLNPIFNPGGVTR
jgi:hypothetical protein